MHLLKQSTAATVIVGPVLDASGVAVTTAVVGDFRIAKEGTSAVLSGATVTHDANGYYLIALTTTNTNTVGRLAIYSNNTAQSMGTTRFMVLLPSVYDALVTNAVNATGGLPAATAQITALAGAISTFAGGAVASVTGAVGSVTAAVTVGTNNDKTGYSLATAPPTAAAIADAVWDELHADHTTDGTYGDSVLIAANNNRTVQVTGSNHVAADIHELQPAVIDSTHFAANWFTAAGLATDAVAEIQSGLATASALATLTGYVDTEVAAIKVVTDRIGTGLVQDGAVWQFTANMLELAPAGGGGGAGDASQATLLEVQDTVESIAASLSGVPVTASGRIADGGTITLYCGDDLRVRSGSEITITVSDVGGSIFTRLDGIGEANLFWGASRQGLPASAISGTIASLSQSGSGASQTLSIVVEIDNAGSSLKPAEDYKWQIESQQDHGAETDSVVEMEGLLSLRRRVV